MLWFGRLLDMHNVAAGGCALRRTEDHVHSTEHGNIQGGEIYVRDSEEILGVNSCQALTRGMYKLYLAWRLASRSP